MLSHTVGWPAPLFYPRRLDPNDAKVLFHPVDFTIFKGTSAGDGVKSILLLDRSHWQRFFQHLQSIS